MSLGGMENFILKRVRDPLGVNATKDVIEPWQLEHFVENQQKDLDANQNEAPPQFHHVYLLCCSYRRIFIMCIIYRVAVLLKYGHPVAKCDPWIHRATQGPTMDGPFGDQWIL